tara:strand:- start:4382 stop:4654 length:273 start_codon:yes stop_codon:yes gene_type:complete
MWGRVKRERAENSSAPGDKNKSRSPGGKRLLRKGGVIDGARTRDSQNHNLELYQLSYDHQLGARETRKKNPDGKRRIPKNLKLPLDARSS